MTEDREQAIRKLAHAMWKQSGEPASQEIDFWLQAEKEIDESSSNSVSGASDSDQEKLE